jgi:hypothetical protein
LIEKAVLAIAQHVGHVDNASLDLRDHMGIEGRKELTAPHRLAFNGVLSLVRPCVNRLGHNPNDPEHKK